MPNFTAGTSFSDGVTNDVTAAKLNALVADAVPTSSLALASTSGTISNFTSSTATLLGAITGSTNVINIGSGQIYKDASGNVGVGTASPASKLHINGGLRVTGEVSTAGASALAMDFLSGNSRLISCGSDASTQGGFSLISLNSTSSIATERLRIDSSGNVGVGTASPTSKLHLGSGDIRLENGNYIVWGGLSNGISGNAAQNLMSVYTNATERLRIDSSGNLLVGKTAPSTSTVGFQFTPSDNKIACGAASGPSAFFNRNTDDGDVIQIARGGSQIGTISATTTAVAYNTSSDYRLKTNLEPISNGIERVKQLPVYRFNWIADQSGNKVDGFVAHEAKTIVPECVTGEKDAVDADGKPIYQGIDQSKIVPLLTAALKEAIAKIEVLESKVATLEAA